MPGDVRQNDITQFIFSLYDPVAGETMITAKKYESWDELTEEASAIALHRQTPIEAFLVFEHDYDPWIENEIPNWPWFMAMRIGPKPGPRMGDVKGLPFDTPVLLREAAEIVEGFLPGASIYVTYNPRAKTRPVIEATRYPDPGKKARWEGRHIPVFSVFLKNPEDFSRRELDRLEKRIAGLSKFGQRLTEKMLGAVIAKFWTSPWAEERPEVEEIVEEEIEEEETAEPAKEAAPPPVAFPVPPRQPATEEVVRRVRIRERAPMPQVRVRMTSTDPFYADLLVEAGAVPVRTDEEAALMTDRFGGAVLEDKRPGEITPEDRAELEKISAYHPELAWVWYDWGSSQAAAGNPYAVDMRRSFSRKALLEEESPALEGHRMADGRGPIRYSADEDIAIAQKLYEGMDDEKAWEFRDFLLEQIMSDVPKGKELLHSLDEYMRHGREFQDGFDAGLVMTTGWSLPTLLKMFHGIDI